MNYVPSIKLPYSKSILNRMLVMKALCGVSLPHFDDECNDLREMSLCLREGMSSGECFIYESGTALRLLTAFFAIFAPGKEFIIRCKGRLAQRPLAVLLDALQSLGMPAAQVNETTQGEKN